MSAIEITASWDGTLVEVEHLESVPPNHEARMRITRGLVTVGIVSLSLVALAFVLAFIRVANWSGGADLAAAVALTVGCYALVHGLLRRKDDRREFVVGYDRFPLVRARDDGEFELTFAPGMSGEIARDGAVRSLSELTRVAQPSMAVAGAFAIKLECNETAWITVGPTTFQVRRVDDALLARFPASLAVDWREQSYTAGTAATAAIFLSLVYSLPPDSKSLSLDRFAQDPRFIVDVRALVREQMKTPSWLTKQPDLDSPSGGTGKRAQGANGLMGDPSSSRATGLYKRKGPLDNPSPAIAKAAAEKAAETSGALGVMQKLEGSLTGSIFGRERALGNQAETVLGGLRGTEYADAWGNSGLSIAGPGPGGGGTGADTVGLGDFGRLGHGGGGPKDGPGYGPGSGAPLLAHHPRQIDDVLMGTAKPIGSLSSDIIRRVVRRHMNEVRYCYEKELLSHPDLFGRVMVQFTISGTGQVVGSGVQASTLKSSAVEQCIAQAVKRWEFPAPQAGIVVVSYPFMLKSAGIE